MARRFRSFSSVQDRYDLVVQDGTLTRIVLHPDVKTILSEIKSFPGRRVAGNKAKEFIRNPYALLPDNAENVILPKHLNLRARTRGSFLSILTSGFRG